MAQGFVWFPVGLNRIDMRLEVAERMKGRAAGTVAAFH
jgi:hypothetical protein